MRSGIVERGSDRRSLRIGIPIVVAVNLAADGGGQFAGNYVAEDNLFVLTVFNRNSSILECEDNVGVGNFSADRSIGVVIADNIFAALVISDNKVVFSVEDKGI